MTFIGEAKPSLEELAHHGVKGQKWGVQRGKPSSRDIMNARARTGSQVRQINAQIDRTNLATGSKQNKEAKKLSEMHTAYLHNPDRATALRLTKGEKYVHGILAVAVPGVGTAVAGGAVGVRVAQRKAVESYLKKQGINPNSKHDLRP